MRLNVDAAKMADRPVSAVMTVNPATLRARDKIAFALHRMNVGGFRHIPILDDDDQLVGVISIRDILRVSHRTPRRAERSRGTSLRRVPSAHVEPTRSATARAEVHRDAAYNTFASHAEVLMARSTTRRHCRDSLTASPSSSPMARRLRLAAGDDVQQAIVLARRLQERARELQTSAERRQQAELDRMIQSPSDKATLVEITDQAFRARLPHRAADQLIHILDVQGVPRFFSALDRTLLRGFQSFGAYLPGVAMPLVKEKMQQETANVVLPAEEELLARASRRAPPRRAADERQLPRRGAAGRGRSRAPAAGVSRGAAAAGDRSHVGEDLDDLLANLGARPRAHGRRAVRPAGAALPRGGEGPVHAGRRHRRAQVRLPRHGGVPRQGDHRRGVHADARPAGAGAGRKPASRCRRTFPIRSPRSSGSPTGPAAASPRAGRRSRFAS